jgi:hypothetical protein
VPRSRSRHGRAAADRQRRERDTPPSLKEIRDGLARLTRRNNASDAIPTNVGGQPAYSVHLSPRDRNGLLSAAEVAWDAQRGVPLRIGLYAKGSDAPVLELAVTDISYEQVPASDFAISPPAGAKVVDMQSRRDAPERHRAGSAARRSPVRGLDAVRRTVKFPLAAPSQLAGLQREDVRAPAGKGGSAAIVTYGRGLGAVTVFEHTAESRNRRTADETRSERWHHARPEGRLRLPTVSIHGADGHEIATALGTIVHFERDGVAYTVLGSVPPAVAEAVARGL